MEELLEFWFSEETEKNWFNCDPTFDKKIKEKYSELYNKEIEVEDKETNSKPLIYLLGKVILFDQISRHIYRNNKSSISKKGLYYSEKILEREQELLAFDPKYRVFVLLPLRHTFQEGNIKRVISYTESWMKEKRKEKLNYYKRFLRSSYISLGKVINSKVGFSETISKRISEFSDILEFYNQESNFDSISFNSRLIREFLVSMKKIRSDKSGTRSGLRANEETSFDTICLSLSGGVDSMVISYLLKYYTKKKIVAVHIDYNQRSVSKKESEFIASWCSILDIPLYIRRISEITKTPENRSIYEIVTKEIRFDMYKKTTVEEVPIVALGHHADDCFENILNNIKKEKCNYNLKGMETLRQIKGVYLFRPLLGVTKQEIVKFARKIGIPYLKDSTRSDTERGNIRDKIVPVLESRYISGLVHLAEEHSEMYNCIITNLAKPFYKDKISRTRNESNVNYKLTEFKEIKSIIFWKYIIYTIHQEENVEQFPSNKSIHAFVDRIVRGKFKKFHLTQNFYFETDRFILIE